MDVCMELPSKPPYQGMSCPSQCWLSTVIERSLRPTVKVTTRLNYRCVMRRVSCTRSFMDIASPIPALNNNNYNVKLLQESSTFLDDLIV